MATRQELCLKGCDYGTFRRLGLSKMCAVVEGECGLAEWQSYEDLPERIVLPEDNEKARAMARLALPIPTHARERT